MANPSPPPATSPASAPPPKPNFPWYNPVLPPLTPSTLDLFTSYSHIPPADLPAHLHTVRDKAWSIFAYPCIGRWFFLDLALSLHPAYPRILPLLTQPPASEGGKGGKLLDLGCCFGQDTRKLLFDGADPRNLMACDLKREFWDLGGELFRDGETCTVKFLEADIFAAGGPLDGIEGEVDVIHASSFLHLFDWDHQVKICKRMARILKPQAGVMVVGRQSGNVKPGIYEGATQKVLGEGTVWRHNAETFEQLWMQVGEETGTKWRVHVTLELRGQGGTAGREGEVEKESWHGDGVRRLVYEVERLM